MEKTSKITLCKFISEWAGPNGTVYYHEIHLQNGDSGQIGTKEKYPAKLEIDKELTYTLNRSGGFRSALVTQNAIKKEPPAKWKALPLHIHQGFPKVFRPRTKVTRRNHFDKFNFLIHLSKLFDTSNAILVDDSVLFHISYILAVMSHE